jgi:hypothetical protein
VDRRRSAAVLRIQLHAAHPAGLPWGMPGMGRRSTGRCSRRRSAGGSPWRHCST